MGRSYVLVYIIPSDEGDLSPGKRLYNWVWYFNLPEGSKELSETMFDVYGKTHDGTVPRGLIRPEVWEKQRALGVSLMPEAIATLLERTTVPFVTKVHDAASSQAAFFGGKLVLVGDALVAFRPHIAMSTNQAAYDCALLEQVMEGQMSIKQ